VALQLRRCFATVSRAYIGVSWATNPTLASSAGPLAGNGPDEAAGREEPSPRLAVGPGQRSGQNALADSGGAHTLVSRRCAHTHPEHRGTAHRCSQLLARNSQPSATDSRRHYHYVPRANRR
jgi:hypothetical protein